MVRIILSAPLAIKFDDGLPTGMLLVNGGADHAFGESQETIFESIIL